MKKTLDTKPQKLHIKSGDKVVVIAGDAKGNTGVVKQVLREKQRVIVEGLNMVKKHIKPSNEKPEGGIVEKEASIHISNVMLADPKGGKPTRVGRKLQRNDKTGQEKLVRFAKKSNEVIK